MGGSDETTATGKMIRFAHLRWLVRIIRHPSAILLLVQLIGLLLYPFIEHTRPARALFGAFGVLVLGLAISMVRRTRGRAWISACIALPAVLFNVLDLTMDMPELRPWWAALEAMFYFYAAGCLISYMLADRRATTDELFAAGATFTLLGSHSDHRACPCGGQPGDVRGGDVRRAGGVAADRVDPAASRRITGQDLRAAQVLFDTGKLRRRSCWQRAIRGGAKTTGQLWLRSGLSVSRSCSISSWAIASRSATESALPSAEAAGAAGAWHSVIASITRGGSSQCCATCSESRAASLAQLARKPGDGGTVSPAGFSRSSRRITAPSPVWETIPAR